jgi:hypothetical protein
MSRGRQRRPRRSPAPAGLALLASAKWAYDLAAGVVDSGPPTAGPPHGLVSQPASPQRIAPPCPTTPNCLRAVVATS